MANKNFKDLAYKDKLSFILCIAAFCIGGILTFLGLLIPPPGEIHATVLTAVGIFLTFAGSVIGISQHYKMELDKIKNEFTNEGSRSKTGKDC